MAACNLANDEDRSPNVTFLGELQEIVTHTYKPLFLEVRIAIVLKVERNRQRHMFTYDNAFSIGRPRANHVDYVTRSRTIEDSSCRIKASKAKHTGSTRASNRVHTLPQTLARDRR